MGPTDLYSGDTLLGLNSLQLVTMPKPVKLHFARNLTELNSKCEIEKDLSNKKPEQLAKSAKLIMTAAVKESKSHMVDEEQVYIYFYRSMELWKLLLDITKKDPKGDMKYFKLMYGEDMSKTFSLLQEYSDKLKTRYSDLETGLEKEKRNFKKEFTLAHSLHAKKKKDNKDKTPFINGINANSTPNSGFETTNDSLIDSNHMDSEQSAFYEEKYIKCEDLKKRIPPQHQDVLLIDIRPQKDYETSRIQHFDSVNIPETNIRSGLSANKLSDLISESRQKTYWKHRDQYNQVVLLDWNSEEIDVIPNSHLSNLYVSLTKWDPQTIYKHRPLILFGGFEQWLDMYPTFTTNAQIQAPPKTPKTGFVHLSEQHIEYPVLEDILAPSPKPALSPIPAPPPAVMPTIDRSTKPDTLTRKADRPADSSELDEPMSEEEISKPVPTEKPPKINQEPPKAADDSSNLTSTQERMEDEPAAEKQPRPIPPRPSTPPRERNHSKPPGSAPAPARRPISDQGEEGDGISFAKLNLDGGTRSGGLKRSSSSPNINKLLDNSPSFTTPAFDRNIKPRTSANESYSLYSPRHGGEDTFNFSSNKTPGRGLTGLKNLGNLCYMNSIMQCISHSVELMTNLTTFNPRDTGGGKRQIATEVASLLRHLWSGEVRVSNCRMLKSKVGALEPRFSTNEQQDSHEFLTLLMDWLHEDLKMPPPLQFLDGADEATGEKAWGEFKKKNNSPIQELFYGQQKSTMTCNSCQKQSIQFEPFWHLSIPLPTSQDNPLDNTRTCSVEDCLRLYLKGEIITGWNCPNCKCPREATKKLDITRLPPVLIIHLKRFMNMMSGVSWCRKRINMVDFPINDFNMKPYTHPDSELRFHNYNLYAVSNHFGSMEGGHYTAYCKNHMQNKWYKFDDQDVNEMSPSDVRSVAAYILFYESGVSDRSNRMME